MNKKTFSALPESSNEKLIGISLLIMTCLWLWAAMTFSYAVYMTIGNNVPGMGFGAEFRAELEAAIVAQWGFITGVLR